MPAGGARGRTLSRSSSVAADFSLKALNVSEPPCTMGMQAKIGSGAPCRQARRAGGRAGGQAGRRSPEDARLPRCSPHRWLCCPRWRPLRGSCWPPAAPRACRWRPAREEAVRRRTAVGGQGCPSAAGAAALHLALQRRRPPAIHRALPLCLPPVCLPPCPRLWRTSCCVKALRRKEEK